ncbi:hypothetical protein [Bordetella genomosp. 4]|nr:hypothetical protein [Bordetella genomosp. 4]
MTNQEKAYQDAMKEARKLSTLKRRSAMAPHVHAWAEALKRMLAGDR